MPLDWVMKKNLNNSSLLNIETSYSSSSLIKISSFISFDNLNQFEIQNKDNIKILSGNIFGNTVIVTDKILGSKICKEENVNVVTNEGEVFYSGGFIAKLGKIGNQFSKLSLYNEIFKLENKIKDLEDMVSKDKESEILPLTGDIDKLEKVVFQLQNNNKGLENDFKMICQSYKDQKKFIFLLTKNIFNDRNNLEKEKSKLLKYKDQIDLYKNKNSRMKKELDSISLKKLEKKLNKIDKNLKNQNEEILNLNNNISDLLTKEVPKFNFTQAPLLMEEEKSRKNSTTKNKKKINKIEKQMRLKNNEIEEKKEILEKLKIEMNLLKNKQIKLNSNVEELRDSKNTIEKKIHDLNTDEEIEKNFKRDKSKKLISKLKNLILRTKNVFTGKDTVVFKKLEEINKKKINFRGKLQIISEDKELIYNCLKKVDKKIIKLSESFFEKFKKNFEKNYKTFEPFYKVETNLNKIQTQTESQNFQIDFIFKETKKNKENKKIFNFSKINRQSFSTGKKVIFALCLLLAFNSIEWSPLYIFDEVDSALDKENLESFINILEFLGCKSQIFFTSFKKDVLKVEDMLVHSVEFKEGSELRIVEGNFIDCFFDSLPK